MEQKKKSKIFYGWIVVAGCVFIRLGLGIPTFSLGVFLKPMCEALGVSRGVFSAYSTFSYVATMIMLPFLGVWFKKYSFKKLMWLGAIMTTIALFCYSFVTEVWHFYLLATLNGTFNGMLNSIPIAMLMANWFKEKRGFATGLAFTGSGISAMFMVPLANYVIENVSWMAAYRIMGIMYLIFMFIPLTFIIKEKPEDMGLKAYGEEETEEGAPDTVVIQKPLTGFTAKQAMRTSTFWLIGACMFLTGFTLMGTQNHVISYLTDIGHSSSYASLMYSIIMFFDTFGKITLGFLYDKIGMRKTNLYIYGLFFTAEVLLLFAVNPVIAAVYGVVMGMAIAVQTGAYPVVINKLLGDKDYSRNYGNLTVCYFGGMALGVPFSGFIFDTFGSYVPAWIGYATIILLIVFLLLFAERRSKAEWENLNAGKYDTILQESETGQ